MNCVHVVITVTRMNAILCSAYGAMPVGYCALRCWMQGIARLVNRFGSPSLAFDHGLARIKEKIEKENYHLRVEETQKKL